MVKFHIISKNDLYVKRVVFLQHFIFGYKLPEPQPQSNPFELPPIYNRFEVFHYAFLQ